MAAPASKFQHARTATPDAFVQWPLSFERLCERPPGTASSAPATTSAAATAGVARQNRREPTLLLHIATLDITTTLPANAAAAGRAAAPIYAAARGDATRVGRWKGFSRSRRARRSSRRR